MKCDIILSGVGGQGILSIAAVIGEAVRREGLEIKQAEVHGMSQRGGDVQTNLRISSEKIDSDLIPKGGADAIISLEPMEALRYTPYLKEDGWVVTSSKPFINIPNYPEIEKVMAELAKMPHLLMLDVEEIANSAKVGRSANIVLLGAASNILGIKEEDLIEGITNIFSRKGEAVVEANIKALRVGAEAVKDQMESK
ncbi:MAG: indolepyruvate oxidoreductase subunit beta [Rikenellaceae bacterium]